MKKKRFIEAQIAFALRQAEGGVPASEVIRRVGSLAYFFFPGGVNEYMPFAPLKALGEK